jgi:hypothetical protein
MRHRFLARLIALLPLRGWVGDVMAAQMSTAALAQPAAVMQHHAPHDAAADPAMTQHADCPGHAMAQADVAAGHDADSSNDEHSCNSCTVCQLCHTPALLVEAAQPPAAPRSVPPQATPRVYTDALRVPGFKPPIA